jgi:hypothetical protein
MMSAMELMDGDMAAAPMTGGPDHDFAAMMIPQGRVLMTEREAGGTGG